MQGLQLLRMIVSQDSFKQQPVFRAYGFDSPEQAISFIEELKDCDDIVPNYCRYYGVEWLGKHFLQERDLVLGGQFGMTQQTVTSKSTQLKTDSVLTLDIVVAGGRMRFQIEGDNFLYKYTFDRPKLDAGQKFAELVSPPWTLNARRRRTVL